MKCLHICESIDVRHGGVARSVIDLVSALHMRGVEVNLACMERGPETGEKTPFPMGLSVHDLSLKSEFAAVATELIRQADIVHLHTPWWLPNRQLVAIARRLTIPVVLTSHGMLDDWSMRQKALKKFIYMKLFGEHMLRRCVIHCTARSEMDQVLKRVKPLAVEVIPLVIDEGYFSKSPEPEIAYAKWPFLRDSQNKALLFLGRVDPKKGLDVAIKALTLLPNSILVVAGPGEEDYVSGLKRLSATLGVADRVRWLGSVFNQEKNSLLAACRCLLLPTQQENFGLVLVEGLSMGMQVITTTGTDIWREIESCGAIIAERTPSSFAFEVSKCLEDTTDFATRLESQRSRLREWLEPDRTLDLYIEMYKKYSVADRFAIS